jgi:hypothetical protein
MKTKRLFYGRIILNGCLIVLEWYWKLLRHRTVPKSLCRQNTCACAEYSVNSKQLNKSLRQSEYLLILKL